MEEWGEVKGVGQWEMTGSQSAYLGNVHTIAIKG